jgi:uncharacterized surface anchored protein
MEEMIKNVKKLSDGKFLINDSVKVYGITVNDNGEIFCDIDYDETSMEESTAAALADELISTAIKSMIDKSKEVESDGRI